MLEVYTGSFYKRSMLAIQLEFEETEKKSGIYTREQRSKSSIFESFVTFELMVG